MKQIIFVLCWSLILFSCGGSGEKKASGSEDSSKEENTQKTEKENKGDEKTGGNKYTYYCDNGSVSPNVQRQYTIVVTPKKASIEVKNGKDVIQKGEFEVSEEQIQKLVLFGEFYFDGNPIPKDRYSVIEARIDELLG